MDGARPAPGGPGPSWMAPLLVFLGALALYAASLAAGVDYGDPASNIDKCRTIPPAETLVGVSGHPLHVLGGWLFLKIPLLPEDFLLNLYSAVAGAVAVAFLFAAVRRWTGSPWAALFAAVSLAFSHTHWLKSSLDDVYALQNVCTAFALWCAVRWVQASDQGEGTSQARLYLLGFALGLGPSHHLLTAFLFPFAFITWLLDIRAGRLRPRHVVLATLAGVAGGLAYLVPVGCIVWEKGLGFFVDQATGTDVTRAKILGLGAGEQAASVVRFLVLWVYQFPSPAFLLGLAGTVTFLRRGGRLRILVFGSFLLNTLFGLVYRESHQYEIYATSYLLFAFLVGCGAAAAPRLLEGAHARRLALASIALLPILVYAAAPVAVHRLGFHLPVRPLPYRDPAWHFLFPPKTGWNGAELFAREGLAKLPPNALVIADWSTYTPLKYVQQRDGLRPDVRILFLESWTDRRDFQAAAGEGHPVFFSVPDLPAFWLDGGLRCEGTGFMVPALKALKG